MCYVRKEQVAPDLQSITYKLLITSVVTLFSLIRRLLVGSVS